MGSGPALAAVTYAQQAGLADRGGRGQRRLGDLPKRGHDLPWSCAVRPCSSPEVPDTPKTAAGRRNANEVTVPCS
jgi:hypothetical protein